MSDLVTIGKIYVIEGHRWAGDADKINKHTIVGDLHGEVMKRMTNDNFPSFMIAPEGTIGSVSINQTR